jgi:hypothetical protein
MTDIPIEVFRYKVNEARVLFEQMTRDRHQYGQLKYGEHTFLGAPTMQMCLEEIADLANYAQYTFIKVALLKEAIETAQVTSMQKSGGETGGFISTQDMFSKGVE